MIPVLSPQDIRAADAWTIAHEPITSIDLMERAAGRCAERILSWMRRQRHPAGSVAVFAGMGNNGGDGLVIARRLHEAGMRVAVYLIAVSSTETPERAISVGNARRSGVPIFEVVKPTELPSITDSIIIDALFGTGLREPLAGLAAEAVRAMNTSGQPIISIDMPSGLFTEDNSANRPDSIVHAALTLTLEVPKLALMLPENEAFVGEWEIVPIGLDQAFLQRCASKCTLVERTDAVSLIKPRPRFGHKGTFGHVLIIGGSTGRMGAMVLAAKAALRTGVGLVSAAVPDRGANILQVCAPEAMCVPGCGADSIEVIPDLEDYSCIAIGPGLSTVDGAARALERLLEEARVPLVFDADALNLLAASPHLLSRIPDGSVLTPHPKEFDRLSGHPSRNGYERLQRAKDFAAKLRAHIVLKGAYTAICSPDGHVHFNPTGNPGMAKGGSGDALTGMLAGMLAQGYAPTAACMLGAYLHGLAGDLAATMQSQQGMTAMSLVEALPEAWNALH